MGVCFSGPAPADINEEDHDHDKEDSVEKGENQPLKPIPNTSEAKQAIEPAESSEPPPSAVQEQQQLQQTQQPSEPPAQPKTEPPSTQQTKTIPAIQAIAAHLVKKPKPKPKPKIKYFVQKVIIYERDTKNSHSDNASTQFFKSFSDETCTPNDDVNTLIEPFENGTPKGVWHWVEPEWTISKDDTGKHKNKYDQKIWSRVAIFELEYPVQTFAEKELVEIMRQLIWHSMFYNKFSDGADEREDSEHNSEHEASPLLNKNDSKSIEKDSEKLVEGENAIATASATNSEVAGKTPPRHSVSNKKGSGTINLPQMWNMAKSSAPDDDDEEDSSNTDENISKEKSSRDNNPLHDPRCVPYISFYERLHKLSQCLYEAHNKKAQSNKNTQDSTTTTQKSDLEKKDETNNELADPNSTLTSATETELTSMQMLLENLALRLQQILSRSNKYSAKSQKQLDTFIDDFVTKQLKTVVDCRLPEVIKEALLLEFYLKILDNKSNQESSFVRLREMGRQYTEAKLALHRTAMFYFDIQGHVNGVLQRLEDYIQEKVRQQQQKPTQEILNNPAETSYKKKDDHDLEDTHKSDDNSPKPVVVERRRSLHQYVEDPVLTDDIKRESNGEMNLRRKYFYSSDVEIERILTSRFASGVLDVSSDEHPLAKVDIDLYKVDKSYKKLVRIVHPDKNKDALAGSALDKVLKAYEMLNEGCDYDFIDDDLKAMGRVNGVSGLKDIPNSLVIGDATDDSKTAATGNLNTPVITKMELNNFQLTSSMNNVITSQTESEVCGLHVHEWSALLQVLRNISHLLNHWLCDAHSQDPLSVYKIMTWYSKIRMIEYCIQMKRVPSNTEELYRIQADIEKELIECMTKSVITDYNRINQRRDSAQLEESAQKTDYEKYFKEVQISAQACMNHFKMCIGDGTFIPVFRKLPTEPLCKLLILFWRDSGRMLDQKQKDSPFNPMTIFALQHMSKFRIYVIQLLKDYEITNLAFRCILLELTAYIEQELKERFDVWNDLTSKDMGKLLWNSLKGNPQDEEEINALSDWNSLSSKIAEKLTDSFSRANQLVAGWFDILTQLPQNELKACGPAIFKNFLNRVLRLLLAFMDDFRPHFEYEEIWKQAQIQEFLKRKEIILQQIEKEKQQRLEERKNKVDRNNLLEMLEKNEDNQELLESKKTEEQKIPTQESISAEAKADVLDKAKYTIDEYEMKGIHKLYEELEKLGYEDQRALIDEAIAQRGPNIQLVLNYLLENDKKKFNSWSYPNNSSDQIQHEDRSVPTVIYGRKGKITKKEYEYLYIMLEQMDLVLVQVNQTNSDIITKVNLVNPAFQSCLQTLAINMRTSSMYWGKFWTHQAVGLLGRHVVENELRAKDMYLSRFEISCDDMHVKLEMLKEQFKVFKERLKTGSLYGDLCISICRNFLKALLWVLCDMDSARLYKRSWIVHKDELLKESDRPEKEETVEHETHSPHKRRLSGILKLRKNSQDETVNDDLNRVQYHVATKLEEDLRLCQKTFVEEFGMDNVLFENYIKDLKQCLEFMHMNSAKLLYICHKQRNNPAMTENIPRSQSLMQEIEIMDVHVKDLAYGVLLHRKKDYIQDYIANILRVGATTTPTESSPNYPLKLDKPSDWDNHVPLFVEIISGYHLRNKHHFGSNPNPVAQVTILDQTYQTNVLKHTIEPRWKDDGFVFLIPNTYFDNNRQLNLLVEFKDGKHFLGMYVFQLSKSQPYDGTFLMKFNGKDNSSSSDKSYGSFEIVIESKSLFEQPKLE